jgi:hypothetical protein
MKILLAGGTEHFSKCDTIYREEIKITGRELEYGSKII